MRILAARYDVPQLGLASTNRGLEAQVSRRCGVKRNFGFVYQREGREHVPDEVTQCNVSDGPFGPEAHLMRPDLDQYLFEAAKNYGALAFEGVKVEDVAFDDDGVDVRLSQGDTLRAASAIDATGRNSVLAKQFGLREEPSRFRTQSRTIFTHMRNVRPYDQVDDQTKQPTPWHEGTLHHIFDSGWMWVIRFAYVDRLSQTLLDNNDKLVAGSYVAFRDFDLWRAWSKMWFLAWNLGVMRLAGAYYQYVETGDAAVLDELHRGELPGTFAPEAPSAQAQFERCFAIMESIDRGEMEIEDAIPEMAFIPGHGEASPAPLDLHDVLRPWHDGSAETQTLIYNWGRTASPAGMRKWFDYDRAIIPLAAQRVHASLAAPLAAE